MKLVKLIMLVVAVILNIVACSGGGSSSTSTSVNEVQKEINANRIEINKTKNYENKNEETQQEAKNNAIIEMVNDATAEINRQVSQQNQESKHSLKIDAVDPDIRNFSYADYGYIDKTINNNKVREYFYHVDEEYKLKELKFRSLSAHYNGQVHMTNVKTWEQINGNLILNIHDNEVTGTISLENEEFTNLNKAILQDNGYHGSLTMSENKTIENDDIIGTYEGVLAGGESKTDMTFGKFEVNKDGEKIASGVFSGSIQ
ncbi:hypothetical protein QV06_10005 [Gallibacterium genomosp. 3]|uniref:Transferrin-binding protein B C-lobe/N-lobe beta barrel domain-containing protein n=1 Tax=Gallibacterium genomosp. 3 TaxID=505345 RepID=A0A1A7PN45_9PAST|nr:hypothetical protein [Gallibacterium genomosp. 3]OBX03176.1 hypothetical protein QV06_10005 [Gallibacterium genomosp. 3]